MISFFRLFFNVSNEKMYQTLETLFRHISVHSTALGVLFTIDKITGQKAP